MTTEYQRSAQRWTKVSEMCGAVNATIGDVCKTVAANKDSSIEEKVQQLNGLKGSIEDMLRIDAEAKGRKSACGEMNEAFTLELSTGEVIENPMLMFNHAISRAINASNLADFSRTRAITEVQTLINSIAPNEDDDEVQVDVSAPTSQRVLKCPLTGRELENPLKNVCGHVYSLEGILQYLYQENVSKKNRTRVPRSLEEVPDNWKAKCAYSGCPQIVRKSNLERDFAAELSQRQRRQATAQRESMEVDNVDLL